MIKDKHQYHVCGWMINQLHLEGRELQCYAIIYSLSQLGEGRYIAGLNFLAEFMQCSQPTASSAVKGLFKKELIKKDEVVNEYGRRVFYYCADPDVEEVDKSDEGGEKENDEGVNKKFMDGVNKKFMSKYNNNENNKEKKKEDDKSSKKKSFVKPTIEEIDAYIKEKGFSYTAEHFHDYYESKGWVVGKSPMKDWKAACRLWEQTRKQKKEEEKEEEPAIELPEGMTQEQWENISNWMIVKIKHIAGKITPVMFAQMKKDVNGNSQLLNNILCDLDYKLMDFCNYDLYDEFKKLLSTDEYQQQL